jgi:hypothetical protein
LIELYSENILALDVCATSKKKLDDFFGNEVPHTSSKLEY